MKSQKRHKYKTPYAYVEAISKLINKHDKTGNMKYIDRALNASFDGVWNEHYHQGTPVKDAIFKEIRLKID